MREKMLKIEFRNVELEQVVSQLELELNQSKQVIKD